MVGWPKIAEAEPILTRVLPVLRCGNAACAPSAIPVQFTEIWCSIAAGEISAMLPEVRTPALFTTTVIVLVGEWAANSARVVCHDWASVTSRTPVIRFGWV
jgi:hypothetical protein